MKYIRRGYQGKKKKWSRVRGTENAEGARGMVGQDSSLLRRMFIK